MKKQAPFLLLSFFALFTITAPAPGASPKQQSGGQHELTIFYANDVKGETEPCG